MAGEAIFPLVMYMLAHILSKTFSRKNRGAGKKKLKYSGQGYI